MLSPRVYNILKFFSEQSEPLFISETNFEFNEIIELRNEGLLFEDSKPFYHFPGAYPYGKNAYAISPKGKDTLLLHDEEVKRIEEETQRSKENLKIAKSSRKWAVVAAWVSIASLLATIVSILLPLLLNR